MVQKFSWILVGLGLAATLIAEDSQTSRSDAVPGSTQKLVARLKQSLVIIRSSNRDGEEVGLGTGFIIDDSGLIATNFHVIGEGRSLRVEMANRQSLKVQAVESSSRNDDLAVLRVEPGKQNLIALPLADGELVEQGTAVLALGNPFGLRNSVTQGIVSGLRDFDGKQLIQLAIPIEPGNSGGPLVDMNGTVQGIVNMKSSIESNVGFAIPVAKLIELKNERNPVLIDRWINRSGVDSNRWNVVLGGEWQERSSLVRVTGSGNGFGGRALCLSRLKPPNAKFEVAVDVKLDEESGAAGLVFHSDGSQRHYGFYPSNGKIRLTCFLGPNVMSWEVIRDVPSPSYIPGEWNQLKVAYNHGHIQGYVNGVLVIDETHKALRSGLAGLAAFRGTTAQFRRFRWADSLSEEAISSESVEWLDKVVADNTREAYQELRSLPKLQQEGFDLAVRLNREAEHLNRRADKMRRLADDAVLLPIVARLRSVFESDESTDLLEASLLVAALDHPDLDIQSYVHRVDSMAEDVRKSLPERADEELTIKALNRFLFEENGYRGDLDDYHHPANNQLDRVIDDREGMPITLSVLYIELARRLNLQIEGVGLPGHFVVRYRGPKDRVLDVFDKAKELSEADVAMMVMVNSERLATEEDLRPQESQEIVHRILNNLINSARRAGDLESIYRYSEGMVALHPDGPEFRWLRGWSRYRSGRMEGAIEDFDWLIDSQPDGLELKEIVQLREDAIRQNESQN